MFWIVHSCEEVNSAYVPRLLRTVCDVRCLLRTVCDVRSLCGYVGFPNGIFHAKTVGETCLWEVGEAHAVYRWFLFKLPWYVSIVLSIADSSDASTVETQVSS